MPEVPVRGTQSFVHTLSSVWRRPSLTALEVAWRWAYGIPAGAVMLWQVRKVLLTATAGTLEPARLGLDKALLSDPVGALTADAAGAAGRFSGALNLLLPGVTQLAVSLLPLLFIAWVLVSGVGRSWLLRRCDARLHVRTGTLMILQALRATALASFFGLWFLLTRWIGQVNVTEPIARGQEPSLILYCALVIVTTLGVFTFWAAASWSLTAAPLVAMARGLPAITSLCEAARAGEARGRWIEINMVMGIVKIALIVLAMVFSATPLPFQDVATPQFLAWWWAVVGVLYLLWSDFFHVAQLVAYLDLWRGTEGGGRGHGN